MRNQERAFVLKTRVSQDEEEQGEARRQRNAWVKREQRETHLDFPFEPPLRLRIVFRVDSKICGDEKTLTDLRSGRKRERGSQFEVVRRVLRFSLTLYFLYA